MNISHVPMKTMRLPQGKAISILSTSVTGIVIRLLSEFDTEAFLALMRAALTAEPDSFIATLEDGRHDPESVRNRLTDASVETGDIVVGAFAPDLIGVISITRDELTKRQHKAELHGMYIKPEFRGRGLGTALLSKSLGIARGMQGLEEIQLVAVATNRVAVSLYARFGFEVVWLERRGLKLADRYIDGAHMTLELTKPV